MSASLLDEMIERLQSVPPEELVKAQRKIDAQLGNRKWIPNPGPQTECYLSPADVVLYGGAAGGGKTDLLLGLALEEHRRSLIMRRQYTDLTDITDRAKEINGTSLGYNGSIPPQLKSNGRTITFGAAQRAGEGDRPGDEMRFAGRARDLLGVDEAAQFTEMQIRTLMGWVRTTEPGQRTRTVLCSNPPLSEEGAWMVSMFAPWLDPAFPDKAEPGELRWCIMRADNEVEWVDGPGEYDDSTGSMVEAESYTFIPADTSDNPYITDDYKRKLDSLPGHMRMALRDGDFGMAKSDHLLQLTPSQWIDDAMKRWQNKPPQGVPMCALGVDIAQGGEDKTVLAPRYDSWFAPLKTYKGSETPNGVITSGKVIEVRRDDALVVLDMGGGYGGSTKEHLESNGVEVYPYKGSEATNKRTRNGRLAFRNVRAAAYYRLHEALDPAQLGGSQIALPPDPELRADLCSIRLKSNEAHIIELEPKKDLAKRIGRSTDKGDAVVMAHYQGDTIATSYGEWSRRREPQVVTSKRMAGRRR